MYRRSVALSAAERDAYNELQAYSLELRDEAFLHQHVVDAWMLQHADEATKPIGVAFALIGMYLHFEKGFTGRQVQRAHTALARRSKTWPSFTLPADRGSITTVEVMAKPPGPQRDRVIEEWSASVWRAYGDSHLAVAELAKRYGYG